MINLPFSDKTQTNVAHQQDVNNSLISYQLLFSFLVLLVSVNSLNAQPNSTTPQPNIVIFYQSQDQQQVELTKYLQDQLTQQLPNVQFESVDINRLTKKELKTYINHSPLCSVTIGESATKKILSLRSKVKTFALNVSHNQLNKLYRTYKRLGVDITGIYQEQTFIRQMLLAKTLQPNLKKISLLVGQVDKYYLPNLVKIAKQNDITLKFKILQPSDTAESFLNNVANQNEFFIVVNNKQLYSKAKLAGLVLTATRQGIRLIGNLIESTKIGVLASVYTPMTSLAIEASNDITDYCESNLEVKPHYAKDFNISVNHKIAEILKLKNIENERLKQAIINLEKIELSENKNIASKVAQGTK
jgi:hypothetical protein